MKLCMNLNLQAKKQNYYLTSLNYVGTVELSVSRIKQKNLKKKNHISCVYYLLSQRSFYLMTVKLPKVRNNPLEEMNPKWDYIVSKNALSTNFNRNRKEE